MNQKFLNNDDFEVQVPFLQVLFYVFCSAIVFIYLTYFIPRLVME